MTDTYRVSLDLAAALAAPETCPACGTGGLLAVPNGDQVCYRCQRCGRAFGVEFGRVVVVESTTRGGSRQCASD